MPTLNTTTGDTEARLVKAEATPVPHGTAANYNYNFTRVWPWVDPTYADGLLDTLAKTLSVSNPYADGQQYTGTFAITTWMEEDSVDGERAVHIFQGMTKVPAATDCDTAAELVAYPYVIVQSEEILDAFGDAAHQGDEDIISFTWQNMNQGSRSGLMSETSANYTTQLGALVTGYTYLNRKWKDEPNNTGTFMLLYQNEAWTNTTPTLKTLAWENAKPDGSDDGMDARKISAAEGIPTASAATILAAASATSGYTLDDVEIVYRKDGEYGFRRRETKQRGTGATYAVYHQFVNNIYRQEQAKTRVWKHLTAANALSIFTDAVAHRNEMWLSSYTAESSGYYLDYIRRDPESNGLFTITRVCKIPVTATAEVWPEATPVTAAKVWYRRKYRRLHGIEYRRYWTYNSWHTYHATSGDAEQQYTTLLAARIAEPGSGVNWLGKPYHWEMRLTICTADSGWLSTNVTNPQA